MSLGEYRRKRDPKKTPEPFRSGGERGSQPVFVVQRHDARRLHYDFRLERDGALASWAVPKGVPLEPGARALAVHVEDHPLEYASFHGEIPAGQYGAGTVEVWDSGTYDLVEEKPDGQLTVELRGSRLRGRWSLVPAHLDGKEQNWLLIKRRDGEERDVTARAYRPMLATPASSVPHGELWAYEVKFDGYRARRLRPRRRLHARLEERQRPDRAVPGGGEGGREGGQVAERRGRRRGVPDRSERARELLGAPARNGRARLLRLRPARARRRAEDRPRRCRSARPSCGSCSTPASRTSSSRRASRTATRSTRSHSSAGSRACSRSGSTASTRRAGARATG